MAARSRRGTPGGRATNKWSSCSATDSHFRATQAVLSARVGSMTRTGGLPPLSRKWLRRVMILMTELVLWVLPLLIPR